MFLIFFQRNLRSAVALLLIDTSLEKNVSLILRVKQEALGAATFEAFLEAAPQLILQLSIVLRTGNISKCLFVMSNFFTISHPLAKEPFVFLYYSLALSCTMCIKWVLMSCDLSDTPKF
jgi:hypothetical protein